METRRDDIVQDRIKKNTCKYGNKAARRSGFPAELKKALDKFERKSKSASKGKEKPTYPAITKLLELSKENTGDKFLIYRCFAKNHPDKKDPTYPVYLTVMKLIAENPERKMRRPAAPGDAQKRIDALANALTALRQNDLLEARYFNAVSIHQQPESLAHALVYLQNNELFDRDDTVFDAVQAHHDPLKFAEAIEILNRRKIIITDYIVDAFNNKHDPINLATMFIELDKLRLLDNDHVVLIANHLRPHETIKDLKKTHGFPSAVQSSLNKYHRKINPEKGKEKKTHPAIMQLEELKNDNKDDKLALYCCFLDDEPSEKDPAYPVYVEVLKFISQKKDIQPRRTTATAENERLASLTEALTILKQNQLLKEPYFDAVTINDQPEMLAHALRYLHTKKLLDTKGVAAAVLAHHHPIEFAKALSLLNDKNMAISKVILNAFDNQRDPMDIVYILSELDKLRMLNEEHVNLTINRARPVEAIDALKILTINKIDGRYHTGNISPILNHEQPSSVAKALVFLNQAVLDRTIRRDFEEQIMQCAQPLHFAKILCDLHHSGLDTSANTTYMIQLLNTCKGIGSVLSIPKNHALIRTILEHPERDHFCDVVAMLDKSRLVTVDNIGALLDEQHPEILSSKSVIKRWKPMADEMTQETFNTVIESVKLKSSYKHPGMFDKRPEAPHQKPATPPRGLKAEKK